MEPMRERPAGGGSSSPSWMSRRHIIPDDAAFHAPWLRLHDHLALRYGIRADRPRRWEQPDAADPLNLPALLRQASTAVDDDLSRTLRGAGHRVGPEALDILRRVRTKPSAGVNLAEYLHTSPQRVSRLCSRLEDAGLVHRDPSWHDLRSRRTALTSRGRDVLDDLERLLDDLLHLWMECLDDDEQRALLLVLRALADEP